MTDAPVSRSEAAAFGMRLSMQLAQHLSDAIQCAAVVGLHDVHLSQLRDVHLLAMQQAASWKAKLDKLEADQ